MALFVLDSTLIFPPVHLAEPDGLLAIGGDLSVDRLLLAYQSGIFPWYEGEHVLWWCPDPRFILTPGALKVSKSMKQLLNRKAFRFSVNEAFPAVIDNCQKIKRPGQKGTWITESMKEAYIQLHQLGYAHSAEVWHEGTLAGGLYGVRLGKVFFGESMFSKVSNASKYAFISFMQQLGQEGIQLIDCQVYTEHLESLGAYMIPRNAFMLRLQQLCNP